MSNLVILKMQSYVFFYMKIIVLDNVENADFVLERIKAGGLCL